jgi:methyl-accepting chemotaxis protein
MGSVTGMVEQFARASQEQSNSSELIRSAVGRMEGLSAQVRNSTREQSKAGCLIARSTENISEMILQIKRACDEQSRGGEQIVVAVGEIQQSAQINLDTATIMSEAANKLAGQVNFLHQEMRVFHV